MDALRKEKNYFLLPLENQGIFCGSYYWQTDINYPLFKVSFISKLKQLLYLFKCPFLFTIEDKKIKSINK